MSLPPCTTAFFDLTTTIAFVQLSADGQQISTFRVYPGAADVLRDLTAKGVRLGFIFQCGGISEAKVRTAMANAGLGGFDDRLLVVPKRPIPLDTFQHAATLARTGDGCADARLLFVSSEPAELEVARTAGFGTALHPRVACTLLGEGEPLRYLRIRVPPAKDRDDWVAALRAQPLVPLHVTAEPVEGAPTTLYAVATPGTAAALDDLGFWVDRLGAPGAPQTTSLYLIHDDLQVRAGFLRPIGNASKFFAAGAAASQVLASTHEGILAALPDEAFTDPFRFVGSVDGHMRRLSPSMSFFQDGSTVAARTLPLHLAAAADPLSPAERATLDRHFEPDVMESTVARYVVIGNATTEKPMGSRNVKHPGNQEAVEALVTDLGAIGSPRVTVERHCFPNARAEFTSVVATLRASHQHMEGQGVVVVSAHLDSTAENEQPYHPETDPAPGADDDASGIAAVLATVRAFTELASLGRPHREIRFVLFNCEENGKSGSGTYASAQAALGTPAAAVFHIDMIGYDQQPPALFEVHAGFPVPDVPNAAAAKARSAEQAQLIEHLRPLTTLPKTEIFISPEEIGVSRSDHAPFHGVGYPACWVTQDFFPDGGECDRNPAYHTSMDTVIVKEYAAQIARLVGAAAWVAATR
ncbi:MAG TPA: M20/M25/M40 family metallo-hydrolase [Longimicrobium sp.]